MVKLLNGEGYVVKSGGTGGLFAGYGAQSFKYFEGLCMRYRGTQESLKALYAVAVIQGGYFTAKQAAQAGYRYPHLAYHVRAGNFERARHGLYRLATIPPAEHDDLIQLALWSRNREDRPQATVSHASALFLHQLSDVLPHRIHLLVPRSFRKAPPGGCTLHKAVFGPGDIEAREGFSVTTPLRTLVDVAQGRSVTDEQLERALAEARQRGLVRETALRGALDKALPASRRQQIVNLMG
jgi:predicted transcriptional regulator of viral defense system